SRRAPSTTRPPLRMPDRQRRAPSGRTSFAQAIQARLLPRAGRRNSRFMIRTFGIAPTAAELEELARAALARLPREFLAHLGEIVLRVEDFADRGTLDALEIESEYDLSGIYEGIPLGD